MADHFHRMGKLDELTGAAVSVAYDEGRFVNKMASCDSDDGFIAC